MELMYLISKCYLLNHLENSLLTDLALREGGTFITMDIETITIDSKVTPYLIAAYNGSDYITSYAKSSADQKGLFTNFIKQLISNSFSSNKNISVYAHNLSGFDGVLLMKHLLSFGKVEPLLFNGKLICIKLKTYRGLSYNQ